MNTSDARELWLQIAELAKDNIPNPTFYIALEHSVGIVLDGDEFIVGVDIADLAHAGILRGGKNMAVIEQCLADVLKKNVRLKIIEGTTIADYQREKQLRDAAESRRAALSSVKDNERAVEQGWASVGDQVAREYSKLRLHGYPQTRGLFMRRAFQIIHDGVREMDYNDDTDDLNKRGLARVFDKLAQSTEVPAAILAYEYFRLRDDGKLQ
jgi:hypothetical protein